MTPTLPLHPAWLSTRLLPPGARARTLPSDCHPKRLAVAEQGSTPGLVCQACVDAVVAALPEAWKPVVA